MNNIDISSGTRILRNENIAQITKQLVARAIAMLTDEEFRLLGRLLEARSDKVDDLIEDLASMGFPEPTRAQGIVISRKLSRFDDMAMVNLAGQHMLALGWMRSQQWFEEGDMKLTKSEYTALLENAGEYSDEFQQELARQKELQLSQKDAVVSSGGTEWVSSVLLGTALQYAIAKTPWAKLGGALATAGRLLKKR